jgi:hypothetical protein
VLVGRVDCDSHPSLGTRFHITKYPTLKYVQNGQLGKKEYRGQRSAQAFLEFVQEQIKNPVQEIRHMVATVLALFFLRLKQCCGTGTGTGTVGAVTF